MLPINSVHDSATAYRARAAVKVWPTGRAVCRRSNLVGEPDAGNPPVRFDEREMETGQGMRF